MVGIGHNSGMDGDAMEMLNDGIKEIEGLLDQRDEIAEAIKEAKQSLKVSGFDVQAVMLVIKQRRMDKDKLDKAKERRDLADTYANALDLALVI